MSNIFSLVKMICCTKSIKVANLFWKLEQGHYILNEIGLNALYSEDELKSILNGVELEDSDFNNYTRRVSNIYAVESFLYDNYLPILQVWNPMVKITIDIEVFDYKWCYLLASVDENDFVFQRVQFSDCEIVLEIPYRLRSLNKSTFTNLLEEALFKTI
jgi:hypothetical protein